MGNRDNQGRYAATQAQGRPACRQEVQEQGLNHVSYVAQVGESSACSDMCGSSNQLGDERKAAPPPITPVQEAQKLVAQASDHDKKASEAQLQLHAQMPFFAPALNHQAKACFKWFHHQGFWPGGWEPHGGFFEQNNNEPAAEFRRLKKAEKLALIHSEVSECLEAVRNNDDFNEAEELADTLVRLLDYAGGFGIDLSGAYYRKMLANYERPFRHGKKF